MIRIALTLAIVALAAPGHGLAKGDVEAGKRKSNVCVACHGLTGISRGDEWPNLAGQKYLYLVRQLKAYRDGKRTDPLMLPMAAPLSDEDVEDLAAYFSAQESGPRESALPPDSGEQPVESRLAVSAGSIVTPRRHPTRRYWAEQMPEGTGRDVIWQKCQLCHDLQRTLAFVRPKEQWQHVVESMIRRGAPVTPEEIPVIVDYFTKYFGPDSPRILAPNGKREVGMRACDPDDWPRGSSDFRSGWVAPHNIWVSNQQGGNLDIVDPSTQKIANRIDCLSAPDRAEFSRDGNTAYVPDRVEHNVTIIDTRTGAITKKIPLIARPNVSVLSRDYKKLYAGLWPVRGNEDEVGYVQIIDTDKLEVVRTIETKGGIHDVWMSRDGKMWLAMSPEGTFMDVYDGRTDELLYTCCTEAEIGTMEMEQNPDGSTRRFFISYSGFSGVVAIDAETGREVKRVPHPVDTEGPYKGIPHSSGNGKAFGFHGAEISPDGKSLWVIQGSFVYKYDLPGLTPAGDVHLALVDQAGERFTPAVEGSWLTIAPKGDKVYAVRPGRNLLSIIDVEAMEEEALIPTGEYPLHISVWPRGTP